MRHLAKARTFAQPSRRRLTVYLALVIAALTWLSCDSSKWRELRVTATAYNSKQDQTSEHPFVAAWGDHLVPGMKIIAVSRDLIPLGLRHGTRVEISGLSGTYRVLDKMNERWDHRIDIYMGLDVEKAERWGKRQVTIRWKLGQTH